MINKNSKWMIVLIAIFCALPPFAIDTYSPAIPNIGSYFNISPTEVMSTFTSYLIGYSFGILLWGPLSDVYGRKKILIIGACLYVISSIICPISSSYDQLVWARLGQGFGDAACATVAMAIARDCYSGQNLVRVLATISTIFMVAPILAPSIGVWILHATNHWQSIFHFLTFYGVLLLILSSLMPETIQQEFRINSIKSSFSHYFEHLRNRRFMLLVITVTLTSCSMFSFIGSSAIIYLKVYNTSEFMYAILFAGNGVVIILANQLLKKLSHKFTLKELQLKSATGALITLISGYFIISTFPQLLWIFVLIVWLNAFFTSICANALNADALNQISYSFGSATSINQFSRFLFAGLANYIMSKAAYHNLNIVLILQQVIFIAAVLVLVIIEKKYFIKALKN